MTELYPALPADDLSRSATIVHADDPGLTHLGIGAGTYTILISGEQTGGAYTLIDMLVPAGGPPPVTRFIGEPSSLPNQTPVVRFAV